MTDSAQPETPGLWAEYSLVWKRRRLLWRSFRSRNDLNPVSDRTAQIKPNDILVVMIVRNEAQRLPWFLRYYRDLGVGHFLIVDNDSQDGTAAILAAQSDVSLWSTKAGYRNSRFGLDWAGWLLMHFGHGHWCLMLDADELLVYPNCTEQDLHGLTRKLDDAGRPAFGALMLDMYAQNPPDTAKLDPETDPIKTLCWFDAGPYRVQRQMPMQNLWVQGGTRERVFFSETPRQAPTLNKLPLMRWNRRWAYVNSCHSILPWRLNLAYDGPGGSGPSGVLLHTKFMPDVVDRAAEDLRRRQHFHDPDQFRAYYAQIIRQPQLWYDGSVRYEGWQQLVKLGLMSSGS